MNRSHCVFQSYIGTKFLELTTVFYQEMRKEEVMICTV